MQFKLITHGRILALAMACCLSSGKIYCDEILHHCNVPLDKGKLTASGPSTSGQPSYTPRYKTIAHDILRLESECQIVEDAKYQFLDSIIKEAGDNLIQRSDLTPQAFFQFVDDLLIYKNFVFPYDGLVSTLTEGLTPRKMTAAEVMQLKQKGPNSRRVHQIDRNAEVNGDFYVVDCDIAAIIYVAIAQSLFLQKPEVYLVEIPGHNFARWIMPLSSYNWDTNYGQMFSDVFYAGASHIPVELVGVQYLKIMSQDEVFGYWHGILAELWDKSAQEPANKSTQKMLYQFQMTDLEAAVRLRPQSGDEKNELAWFLATCPLAEFRDGKKAIATAMTAVAIWQNPNWLDTLAAAYAESHQWDIAVQTETRAKEMTKIYSQSEFIHEGWPDFDKFIDAYSHHLTYVEYIQKTKGSEEKQQRSKTRSNSSTN